MIGISFEIPNNYGSYIKDIFKGLKLEDYYWNIFDSEVLNLQGKNLFLNNIYNSNTLSHFNNENYYLIFTNFQGYKYKNSYDNIKSYSEFLKSDCEIIVVIVDSIYVDIFAKSSKILNTIRKNAFDNGYMNIKSLYKINETFRVFGAIDWWKVV